MPHTTLPLPGSLGLLTDLYELTMAQCYVREGRNDEAVFEMFVREMPPRRSFLVMAGLEDVVHYLLHLGFGREETGYLASLGRFDRGFLRFLAGLKFTGDLWAMPEGTVFFPDEPVLRVAAPRVEAQLVETFLLNAVNFQVLAATKAARIAAAARGKPVVDFSLRRSHGADAALKVARSSWLAGFAGTSNVLAGRTFGIPVFGTVAHSFVMSYRTEREAFEAMARTCPAGAIFLLDTYDVMRALEEAIRVARASARRGFRMAGVRLDSGDILTLSRKVRARLDSAGFRDAKIFASGDLDEYSIGRLIERGAPVDSFGVGTALGTSRDSPALGINYKLVADGRGPEARLRMKLAAGKRTWPGAKQVWRKAGTGGAFRGDVVALADELPPGRGAGPLLSRVMTGGRLAARLPGLEEARARCAEELKRLPSRYRKPAGAARYPVAFSAGLRAHAARIAHAIRREGGVR